MIYMEHGIHLQLLGKMSKRLKSGEGIQVKVSSINPECQGYNVTLLSNSKSQVNYIFKLKHMYDSTKMQLQVGTIVSITLSKGDFLCSSWLVTYRDLHGDISPSSFSFLYAFAFLRCYNNHLLSWPNNRGLFDCIAVMTGWQTNKFSSASLHFTHNLTNKCTKLEFLSFLWLVVGFAWPLSFAHGLYSLSKGTTQKPKIAAPIVWTAQNLSTCLILATNQTAAGEALLHKTFSSLPPPPKTYITSCMVDWYGKLLDSRLRDQRDRTAR